MGLTEKRTQIYLPAELHERVQRYARQRGLSIAAVIRLSLQHSLEQARRLSNRHYEHDPVWKLIGAAESKDGDLSTRHDYYLYGKPRSKPS